MKREIICIDPEVCDGCGQCVEACPEGAIQIINGKARLVSEIYCDGLGVCVGECSKGAISVEKRESELYDERKVIEGIVPQGERMIVYHLRHLKEHGAKEWLNQALEYLEEKGIIVPEWDEPREEHDNSRMAFYTHAMPEEIQWPIQLQLIPASSPFLKGKEMLLVANCAGFVRAGIRSIYDNAASLVIACPKLDRDASTYSEKIAAMVEEGDMKGITVVTMEVPCCNGLVRMVENARIRIGKDIPATQIILSRSGAVKSMRRL